MSDTSGSKHERPAARLGAGELAELIVDALVRAHIVNARDVDKALKVTTEEIEARKALGDY